MTQTQCQKKIHNRGPNIGDDSKHISFVGTRSLKKSLQDYAYERDLSVSTLIRQILTDFVA